MIIMALDISTTSTGVAILEDDELKDLVCIAPPGRNVYNRIEKTTEEIEKIYNKYKPNKIIAEEPEPAFVKNNINVYRKLTFAHGDIAIMLNRYGEEMELVSASHWRKNCGIKTGRGITRAQLKPKDIELAKELYKDYADDIGNNDDKADAILIGHSWFIENGVGYNWE